MVFEESNDAVASECGISSESRDYNKLNFRVMVNLYVPLFWGLAHGGRKLVTHTAQYNTRTHTHTQTHTRSRLLL